MILYFRIGELIDELKFIEKTGAFSSADLVMARGASTYVDWYDPEEVEKVRHLFICKYHESELLRQWKSKKFHRHMKLGNHDRLQKKIFHGRIIDLYNKAGEERSIKEKAVIQKTLISAPKELDNGKEIVLLGWALPTKQTYVTNPDVNAFIEQEVLQYVNRNERPNAKTIFKKMQSAELNGKVRFPKSSRLAMSQINSRATRYYEKYRKSKKKSENIMESVIQELERNEGKFSCNKTSSNIDLGNPEIEILDSELIIDPFDTIRNCYKNRELEDQSLDHSETITSSSTHDNRRRAHRRGGGEKSKHPTK